MLPLVDVGVCRPLASNYGHSGVEDWSVSGHPLALVPLKQGGASWIKRHPSTKFERVTKGN